MSFLFNCVDSVHVGNLNGLFLYDKWLLIAYEIQRIRQSPERMKFHHRFQNREINSKEFVFGLCMLDNQALRNAISSLSDSNNIPPEFFDKTSLSRFALSVQDNLHPLPQIFDKTNEYLAAVDGIAISK
jgi:hypothetical protein